MGAQPPEMPAPAHRRRLRLPGWAGWYTENSTGGRTPRGARSGGGSVAAGAPRPPASIAASAPAAAASAPAPAAGVAAAATSANPGAGCVLEWTRADATRAGQRPGRDPWGASALLAVLAFLLVSPSITDGQAMREQRYCFNLGDGVCDEGPYAESPCAVGSDEHDCRRQVDYVEADPYGPGWQPGRVIDADDDRWPTTWRSAAAGTQSVTVELDRPRCFASLRVGWWDTFSARDYVVMHSLDSENWSVLFTGADVAIGYGNRIDDWVLPTATNVDGSVVGSTGRLRFLRLDMTSGHDAYYELRDVSWAEDDGLCPACNVCADVVLNGEASTCALVATPSGVPCAYTAADDPDGVADTGDEVAEACEDALMGCAACAAQGCAWCDEPSGATCKPDTASSCMDSSHHTSSWRTPETMQRRTCAGDCSGDYCDPEPGEWLEAPTYTSPPFWPAPTAVLPAAVKRDGVPCDCAAFDLDVNGAATCITTDVCAGAIADQATCEAAGDCTFAAAIPNTCTTTVILACAAANADAATCAAAGACTFTGPKRVASSVHANAAFGLDKLFDGITTQNVFMNVWETASTCAVMGANGFCETMEPQWVQYDFGAPQAICSYAMRARKAANMLWMSPKSWQFQGSNDGYHWVTISQVSGEPEWAETAAAQLPLLRSYDPGLGVFRWYRIYFTEVFDEGAKTAMSVALQEIYFFAPLNECISDPLEYESAAPTASTDRECTAVLVCTVFEYETVAPTATSDRVCTGLTFCQSFEYESLTATATSNRECTILQTCPTGSYESAPATWVARKYSSNHRLCCIPGNFLIGRLCLPGSYECTSTSQTCYYVTDRTCLLLPNVEEFEVSRVYSDALILQWSRPVIARNDISYEGFDVYLNGVNAKAVAAVCEDGGAMCADATTARGGCHLGCTGQVAISTAGVAAAIDGTAAAGSDAITMLVEDTTIAAGQALRLDDAFGHICGASPKGLDNPAADLIVGSVLAAISVAVSSVDASVEIATLADISAAEQTIVAGQVLRLVNVPGEICLATPTESALVVASVGAATCITKDVCAGAIADQATCEAAGDCTFAAAIPNTCTTTVLPVCAAANADAATCAAAGACTFTGPKLAFTTDIVLGDAPTIPGQICTAFDVITTMTGYDGVIETADPVSAGFELGDTVEITDDGSGGCVQIAGGAGPYVVTAVDPTSLTISGMAAGTSDPPDATLCLVGRPAREAATQCALARYPVLTFATDITTGDPGAAANCVITRAHTCAGTASCTLELEGQAADCPQYCDYDPGPADIILSNDFSASLGLVQNLIGLDTSSSYTITIRTLWQTFGPSIADKQITQVTGPPVSPAGQGTALWADAIAASWTAPASLLPIMGWVLHGRLAPYVILDQQDCGGTAIDPPVAGDIPAATVPACIEACDANLYCCGFRYDAVKAPLQCTLVTSCTYDCGHGCIGNFYKKQVAVRDIPRDVASLHFDNNYRSSSQTNAVVKGLRAGASYDFWAVALIVVDGALMESLPKKGPQSVMPSFQQATVPAGTSTVLQVTTTLRRSDSIQVTWDAPDVPNDVVIDGYQVYYTDLSETLGDVACADDGTMACQATEASCKSKHASGVTMASGCCVACAGVGIFPDTPSVSSLDLFPRCGHCGVFMPATPRQMLVRGLTPSTIYDFYMVPIVTDQDLSAQAGYPYDGISLTALSFSEWTAPDVLPVATTTTLAFDSVGLSWTSPTLPNDRASIVGYNILYRRSLCGYYENSNTLSTAYGVNAFLGTGPITSATITSLPERNTDYDFVVVPVITDMNGLETLAFPYTGGTEALPQEPATLPLVDDQVVNAHFTGRTADVPGRPTHVVATPLPNALEVTFQAPAVEGRFTTIAPMHKVSLVPEVAIYTIHCEAAGECVFAAENPYSGRAASCTAIATTFCEGATLGQVVNLYDPAEQVTRSAACEAAGRCSYTVATDPNGVPASGDETDESCWPRDTASCGAVDLDRDVFLETPTIPAVVPGLLNGVTYEVTVASANEFGYGRDSITPSTGLPYSDCQSFVAVDFVPHSDVTCHGGSLFGAVCELECHVGFYQVGDSFYECQATGEWLGDMQCLDVNECSSTPCVNGGSCRDSSDSSRPLLPFDVFNCTCAFGYVTDDCSEYANPCDSNPCLNGICVHGSNWDYTCGCTESFQGDYCERCDPGWEHSDCSVDVDECLSSPCYNSGVCFESFNTWLCDCLVGFLGDRCEINVDECTSSPCQNSATCKDGDDAFTCECQVGVSLMYSGELCQSGPMARCSDANCAANAACGIFSSVPTCICMSGYTGDGGVLCTDIDECASNPCGVGGVCTETADASCQCACHPGYDGVRCDMEVYDCISTPCENGAICSEAIPGYACACKTGFSGDECATNDDDCASAPCLNGGTCSDFVGEFNCFCEPGYSGGRCESELDLCLEGIDDCDRLLSTCTKTGPGTYSCICIAGYDSVDGYSCTDIDECSIYCIGTATETSAASCTGTSTVPGICTAIDPTNAGHVASCIGDARCSDATALNQAVCLSRTQTWTAASPALDGNPSTCTVRGTSLLHYHRPCDYTPTPLCAATFSAAPGTALSDCPAGCTYAAAIVPTCDRDISTPYAHGSNDSCPVGCSVNPCDVTGTAQCFESTSVATVAPGRYVCQCRDGFTRETCDLDIDECAGSPCQNGGTCDQRDGYYTCACATGYDGYNCENESDECRSDPCAYGTCTDAVLSYTCACDAGWDGDNCANDLNECLSQPCQNGATCGHSNRAHQVHAVLAGGTLNAYTCACAAGYSGPHCESDVDECSSSPCLNGGRCIAYKSSIFNFANSYRCKCLPGYDDEICGTVVNPCARQSDDCDRIRSECAFSAVAPGAFTCTCKTGWAGLDCSDDIQVPTLQCPPSITLTNLDGKATGLVDAKQLLPIELADNSGETPLVTMRTCVADDFCRDLTPGDYIHVHSNTVAFPLGTSSVDLSATDTSAGACGEDDGRCGAVGMAQCGTACIPTSSDKTGCRFMVTVTAPKLQYYTLTQGASGHFEPTVAGSMSATGTTASHEQHFFDLRNMGTAPLQIDSVTSSVKWAFIFQGGAFTQMDAPTVIKVGEYVRIGVLFHSTSAGVYIGGVTVTSNDPFSASTVIPLTFTASQATVYAALLPDTIPQQVMAPLENAVAKAKLFNVKESSISWELVGCTGSSGTRGLPPRWFDVEVTIPPGSAATSAAWLGASPQCDGILTPGTHQALQVVFDAPYRGGVYTAAVELESWCYNPCPLVTLDGTAVTCTSVGPCAHVAAVVPVEMACTCPVDLRTPEEKCTDAGMVDLVVEACIATDAASVHYTIMCGAIDMRTPREKCTTAGACAYRTTLQGDAQCIATDAAVCVARALDGTALACTCGDTPSGVPCAYTAADAVLGTAEACAAVDEATCSDVKLVQETINTCSTAGVCTHRPAVASSCTFASGACAAADESACSNVFLDGTVARCTNAGLCSHTAAVAVVDEDCVAIDAAACGGIIFDGSSTTCTNVVTTTGDQCVYTPASQDYDAGGGALIGVLESCKAAAAATCDGVILDGTAATCTTGNECNHIVAVEGVFEACVATDIGVCTAASLTPEETCTAAGACTFTALVLQVDEACEPVSPAVGCMIQDPTCASSPTLVVDTERSISMLEVSMVVQPGAIDAAATTVQIVDSSKAVAGQSLPVQVVPVDAYANGGTNNAIFAAGYEFILELTESGQTPLYVASYHDADTRGYFFQVPLAKSGTFTMRVDTKWTGGTYTVPLGLGDAAEEMLDDCGGGANQVVLHSLALDITNYQVPLEAGPLRPAARASNVAVADLCARATLDGNAGTCTGVMQSGGCSHTPASVGPVVAESCAVATHPLTYATSTLTIGSFTTAGEAWTVSQVPAYLDGLPFIQTMRADISSPAATSDWICFDIDRAATVYILYDNRALTPPTWLTDGFQQIGAGAFVSTVDGTGITDTWDVYAAERSAGTVCLGGNDATSTLRMYIPVVGPHEVFSCSQAGAMRTMVGIRAQGITITPGAYVHDVYLTFNMQDAYHQSIADADITITMEAVDDAAALAGGSGELSSKSAGTKSVTWQLRSWANDPCERVGMQTAACGDCVPMFSQPLCSESASFWKTVETPDLSELLREVTDRPGWTADNAVMVLIHAASVTNAVNPAKAIVGETPSMGYSWGEFVSTQQVAIAEVSCWANSQVVAGTSTCVCNDGYHAGEDLQSCQTCPQGHYGTVATCLRCADGKQPIADRTGCELCAAEQAGRYGVCGDCETGRASNAARTSCDVCPTGYAGKDGVCAACPVGTEPSHSQEECLTCPSTHTGDGTLCTICGPGTEPNAAQTACVSCPASYVGIDSDCVQCDDGQAPNSFGVACEPCPPGTAGLNGVCTQCAALTTPTVAKIDCEGCRTGTVSSGGICVDCANGFAGIDGVCEQCGNGKEPDALRATCTPCAAGHAGREGTCFACGAGQMPSADLSLCMSCLVGTYGADGLSCQPCAAGQQPNLGKTACDDCGFGLYSEDGRGCLICASGYEPTREADTCVQCVGGYSPDGKKCQLCRPGERPNARYASASCVQCQDFSNSAIGSDGVTCQECAPGYEPNHWTGSSNSVCVACTARGLDWFSADGAECSQCPPGSEPNAGRTSCVFCITTGSNTYTPAADGCAPVGMELGTCGCIPVQTTPRCSEAGPVCTVCAAGKEPLPDRTDCFSCANVSDAHYSPDGTVCNQCLPGYQPNADLSGCDKCPLNTVSIAGSPCRVCDAAPLVRRYLIPDAEQVTCIPCPGNTYFIADTHECHVCEPGFTLNPDRGLAEPCIACETGEVGVDGTCTLCAPGLYANDVRTQCLECGDWELLETYHPNGLVGDADGFIGVDGVCQRCIAGKAPAAQTPLDDVLVVVRDDVHTDCPLCPLGRYSDEGVECKLCEPAYEPNQMSCMPESHWQAGMPAFDVAIDARTNSGVGAPGHDGAVFTLGAGATGCVKCLSGWYSPGDGEFCSTCPMGQQPNAAQTACEHCGPGKVSGDGRIINGEVSGDGVGRLCLACPPGTQPNQAHDRCIQCEDQYSYGGMACLSCRLGDYPETRFLATKCLQCSDVDDRMYGPNGIFCEICGPGTQPDHFHEVPCAPIPGMVSCPGVEGYCLPAGSQCTDPRLSTTVEHETSCALVPGLKACQMVPRFGNAPWFHHDSGHTSIGDCIPIASPCSTDAYNDNSACLACALIADNVYSTEGSPCRECEPGKEPNLARTECVSCVHLGNNLTRSNLISPGGSPCFPCAAGFEPNLEHTECLECTAGKYSSGGISCGPCEPGQQPSGDATGCVPCNGLVDFTTYAALASTGASAELIVAGLDPMVDEAVASVNAVLDELNAINDAAHGLILETCVDRVDACDGYIPEDEVVEACNAPACTFTAGEATSCTGTVGCTYTADDANTAYTDEEVCAAPTCTFTAGDASSCTGTTGCAYVAPVSTCPSANCTMIGVAGIDETCTNMVADCVTGYVPGNVALPSITCPSGCVLTPAVAPVIGVPGLGTIVRQISYDFSRLPNIWTSGEFIPGDTLYSLDGTQCLACFHGMTPDPLHAACVKCSEGRAGTFGVCKDCVPGKVPNALQTNCVPCEVGKYNPDYGKELCMACFGEGLHIPSFPGTSCVPCQDGTVPIQPLRHTTPTQPGCQLCEPGWSGLLGVCEPCPGGRRSSPDHTTCDKCPTGKVSPEGTECNSCRPGTRPNPKQAACNLCPDGRYSPDGLRCIDCWALSVSRADRTWCLCAPGSEDVWEIPVNSTDGQPVATCKDKDECLINNGGCDESTQCYNLSPGRFCGECPVGYFGEYYSLEYSVLEGNTTCIEPPVDDDEDILSPELKLMMDASPAVLQVQVAVGNEVYYDHLGVRAVSTIAALDKSDGDVTVSFEDGANVYAKFAEFGQGISLKFADGTSKPTDSQKLLSPERQELEQGLISDLAESLGVNESKIQITSIINPRARRLQDKLAGPRRLQTIGVEVTFIIISDLPAVFDDLNNQLADPNSTLLTSGVAGLIYRDQFFNLSDGLEVFEFTCTDRLVHDEQTDTCLPCPAGTEYLFEVGERSCILCPEGMWSPLGGFCTDCPEHEFTPSYGETAHVWCYRCDAGNTVNATSSGCEACKSDEGYYNADGRECTLCEPGTRPERLEAARYCVSCQVDGTRHFSSRGLYRDRTTACTATALLECVVIDITGDDIVWASAVVKHDHGGVLLQPDVTVGCVAKDEEICSTTDLRYSWLKYANHRLEGCTVDGCFDHGGEVPAQQACIALGGGCGGILENPSGSWQTRSATVPSASEGGQNGWLKQSGVLVPRDACNDAGGGGTCNHTMYEDEVLEKCEATVEHPRTGLRGDMRICGGGPGTCRGCSAYSHGSTVSCITAGQGLPGTNLQCEYTAADASDPSSTDSCVSFSYDACAAIDVGDPRVNVPNDRARCELAGAEPGVCTYTPFLPTIFETCDAVDQVNCSTAEVTGTNRTADLESCDTAGQCMLWTGSRFACESAAGGDGECKFTDETDSHPRSCLASDRAVCADANTRRDEEAYTFDTPNRTRDSQEEACMLAGACSYTSEIPAVVQPLECDEMCGAATQVNTTSLFTSCERCLDVGPRHVSLDGEPCVKCPPGRQPNNERTFCYDCPAGTFSDQADNGWHCRACPHGWEPTTRIAAAACTPCVANHYSVGDQCHRCDEDTVTQTLDGMVIAFPGSAEQCRCPDGTYDSSLPAVGTSHIFCWDDGVYTSLPWVEPSNFPSEKDVTDGKQCVACPSCLECDGGVPRVRAGYHVGGNGTSSETLMLLPTEPAAGDRHVYRCPRPELCLGEVTTGCDLIDCTPLWYEAETGHALTSTLVEFTRTDHSHGQADHIPIPPLLAAGLGGSRCLPGFDGRLCLGKCVDGEGGSTFCDSRKCNRTDWWLIWVCVAAPLLLLGMLVSCCDGQRMHRDARPAHCCTRKPKDDRYQDDPEGFRDDCRSRPCRVHGSCSFATFCGFASTLGKPLALLWPRLRIAALLLTGLYQILSSLSTVLALPLPQRAWSLIEFFAPLANLDMTLFPSIGCGLGFYSSLWVKLFTVAGLIVPVWVVWFLRTNCNCIEMLRNHNGGTLRPRDGQICEMPHRMPRPERRTPFPGAGGEPFEEESYQDRTKLAMIAKRRMRNYRLRESMMSWTFTVVYLAHPSIVRSMLQLYDCRSMDDGSSHLIADVKIVCTEPRPADSEDLSGNGPLDPLYAFYLTVASGVLAACLAVPVLAALKLWHSRKGIADGLKQPGLAPFYIHCRPECYTWEIWFLFARSAMAGGLIVWERGSLVQLGSGALLSSALFATAMWTRPLESGPATLSEFQAAHVSELVSEAKVDLKAAKDRVKLLHQMKGESKKHGIDNTEALTRKQNKVAAKMLKPLVVAGLPDRAQHRERFVEVAEKEFSVRLAKFDGLGVREKIPQGRTPGNFAEYWAQQLPPQTQRELADKIEQVFEEKFRTDKRGDQISKPEKYPEYTIAHLQDYVAQCSLQIVIEGASEKRREAKHKLLQLQRRLKPSGSGAGRLANVALVVCLGCAAGAYALCLVIKTASRFTQTTTLSSQPYGLTSLPETALLQLEHERSPLVTSDLAETAGVLLWIIQIPPLVTLTLMVLLPLRADCIRARAARSTSRFEPKEVEVSEEEDDSAPATPVSEEKPEVNEWPEKDEDTEASRSRLAMENAFEKVGERFGRKKPEGKYIKSDAA